MTSPGLPSARSVKELILPIALLVGLLVVMVPLPPQVMDFLLAANITVSVLVLLATLSVRLPSQFHTFPTVLLAATLFRLVLNIATTRLILTQAPTAGLDAAGRVVRQFGQLVAADQLVVGFVIFGIILTVQYLVITQGATRISEVAARFSLDGLPGRQMSIDADLNAGVIDEHEARERRAQLTYQSEFYGSMDGASKFVRGDAVAGLVITGINVAGGLCIGVVQAGMPVGQAAQVFTRLTIGDGLVTQVPALLTSMAAAVLVTPEQPGGRSFVRSDRPDRRQSSRLNRRRCIRDFTCVFATARGSVDRIGFWLSVACLARQGRRIGPSGTGFIVVKQTVALAADHHILGTSFLGSIGDPAWRRPDLASRPTAWWRPAEPDFESAAARRR